MTRRFAPWSVGGLIIAFIALGAAALSPWAVAAIEPPPKPIDEHAVDIAVRVHGRISAHAQGQEYVPPVEATKPGAGRWYIGGVVGLSVVAMCVGTLGLVLRQDYRLTTATISVGGAALLLQYALVLAAALLVLLLVGLVMAAVLGAAGVDV